jgi:hypothetical protein
MDWRAGFAALLGAGTVLGGVLRRRVLRSRRQNGTRTAVTVK